MPSGPLCSQARLARQALQKPPQAFVSTCRPGHQLEPGGQDAVSGEREEAWRVEGEGGSPSPLRALAQCWLRAPIH